MKPETETILAEGGGFQIDNPNAPASVKPLSAAELAVKLKAGGEDTVTAPHIILATGARWREIERLSLHLSLRRLERLLGLAQEDFHAPVHVPAFVGGVVELGPALAVAHDGDAPGVDALLDEEVLHGTLFPLFIYGVVFVLWILWVTKYSGYVKKYK